MTASEKQEIVNAVLSALKTNSLDILDLTEVSSLPDDAYIEVSGGRKMRVSMLVSAVLDGIDTGSITTNMLVDLCVTSAKLANSAVTLDKIDSNAFGSIAAGSEKLVKSGVIHAVVTNLQSLISGLSTRMTNAESQLSQHATAIGNAQTTASNAQTTANNAKTAADQAKSIAEGVERDVTDLKNRMDDAEDDIEALEAIEEKRWLTIDQVEAVMDGVSTQAEYQARIIAYQGSHDIYRVSGSTRYKIGEVKMYTDNMFHQFTQEVSSNFVLDQEGSLSSTHDDGASHVFRRHFNYNAPNNQTGADWPQWTWSAWKEVGNYDAAIKDLEESASTLADAVSGHEERMTNAETDIDNLEDDVDNLKAAVDNMSSVAGIFNVTNEVTIKGYYVLIDNENTTISAVHATWNAGKRVSGIIISFEYEAGKWKTYQYVGKEVSEANWKNESNWRDFGNLAAGSETYVIIDNLVPSVVGYYTLESALTALLTYQTQNNVNYAKKGMIISYSVGENVMETKQFQGEVNDFNQPGLWKDFGGGGTEIETSDEPESGGEDAFSTGGAYAHLPVTAVEVESEDEDKIALALVNEDGDPLGAPFYVPKGGGGSTSNKVFSINFDPNKNPFYGRAGGQFVVEASIRSVKTEDGSETSLTIERVDIVDRDSGQTLYSNPNLNQRSSSSSIDYSFSFDLSTFFASATGRRLQVIAYDDEGDVSRRTLNVVSVDVTVVSTQVLNYSNESVVFTTDSVKSLTMYRFPVNTGASGIKVTTEMLLGGVWKKIGEAIVTDTYSHNITINPSNVDGDGTSLSHGAYPIRIQGQDVASGVKGNVLYSAIMVVDVNSNTPIVVLRYAGGESGVNSADGTVRLYDNMSFDIAAYKRGVNEVEATFEENGSELVSVTLARTSVETVTRQVTGVEEGDLLTYEALCGSASSGTITVLVSGSVIDAVLTEGSSFAFDFANRSNSESGDHSIVSGQNDEYSIVPSGVNWSSNGFIKYLGSNAFAVKENVTAKMLVSGNEYKPFGSSGIENSGFALLFAFASDNALDPDVRLFESYDPSSGAGFYVTGKNVGIFCRTGQPQIVERNYPAGERVTVGIVVEPGADYIERDGTRYSTMKLYINGEEAGCLGYVPGGGNLVQNGSVKFDGTQADFYLYYLIGWYQSIGWKEQFYDYLVKLSDTSVMVKEYDFEDVWEGGTQNGPKLAKLAAKGMPYIIESPFLGYSIDALDNTTSTKDDNWINLTYIDPQRPWRNFIAYNVRVRNQGTTSARRPIKNHRYYLNKPKNNGTVTYEVDGVTYTNKTHIKMLNPDETTEAGRRAIALAALNKVQVGDNTIPVDIITVKVDYSDSSNANDCGACNMMNTTFRALGNAYMTPAQRYYDGTYNAGSGASAVSLEGLQLNHSTANHPVAVYRDPDGTGANTVFYAKGNWKEDKGEQVALGFKDTPGYNKGCLNYGDFVEYFGTSSETLAQTVTRFLADSSKDQTKVYLISMYCGSSYKFYRYKNGAWTDTTGRMHQVNGKWTITGDVLNPVDGFELLTYTGMDWWQGVSSVSDMMEMTTETSSWVQKLIGEGVAAPMWTKFFECMIDDDDLQLALAQGKKVPYWLYRMLRFCDSCDYSKVTGFKAIWRANLYKYAKVRPLMAYLAFTDYLAATDQQAKNMQPMFFLDDGGDVNGGVYADESKVLMYPNKIYDADTLVGFDNEGDTTVDAEVDPTKPDDNVTGYKNPYAGWGSVLWRNLYAVHAEADVADQTVVENGNGDTVTLGAVVSDMRSVQETVDGENMAPFSIEGAKAFFINQIVNRWQKQVSSYDGEKKYISFTATADALYYYALHGLRLASLPDFINRRFRYRDGYYGTGTFFNADTRFGARVNGADGAQITVRVAKEGYVGATYDTSDDLRLGRIYLTPEDEDPGVFTMPANFGGLSFFLFLCDRISEIDLSALTLSADANLSVFKLINKMAIGGDDYVDYALGYKKLTNIALGSLPFLTELNLRNHIATNVDASKCPRLEKLYASGSQLTDVKLAETSPVSVLELPDTVTSVVLVNLPNLKYGTGALTFEGLSSLTSLRVGGCPLLDVAVLLTDAVEDGARITRIRATDLAVNGPSSVLLALIESGAIGMDADGQAYDESGQCSGLIGTWTLTDLVEESVLTRLQNYYPQLTIYNAQYTVIMFDDSKSDDINVTNLDNGSSASQSGGYRISGHITKLKSMMHLYKGTFNNSTGKMQCEQVKDDDLYSLTSGDALDVTDQNGVGYDIFVGLPHYWYKGINDYIGRKKYIAFSTEVNEPRSSASVIRRSALSEAVLKPMSAVYLSSFDVGDAFNDENLTQNSSNNVYQMDVSGGMKQVRWPGVNSNSIGALFLDADGKVLSKIYTYDSNANSDFLVGSYVFVPVPDGAAQFVFTSPIGYDTEECIVVNSSEIEAIEPDWVEHDVELVGVYEGYVDNLKRMRSVSGVTPTRGNNTQRTSNYWAYNSNGDLTVGLPPSTESFNYTCKDFINLAKCRGDGYQCIDYEMSKDIANIWMAFHGRRNAQQQCGNGVGTGAVTGGTDAAAAAAPLEDYTVSNRPRTLGFEDLWANLSEWMDNVAINVSSFNDFYKMGSNAAAPTGSVVDHKWRIRMHDGSERVVQGASAGGNIARVRGGRYADVVPSAIVANTAYNTYYCDAFEYGAATPRVVARSGYSTSANFGIVYANANCVSSSSNTYFGSRLAFRGEIEFV